MLLVIFGTCFLVVVTMAIHASGFSVLLRAVMRSHALTNVGLWHATRVVIAVACWLLLVHLSEIVVWGLFYLWQGWMPDAGSALYFSGVTYTGTGYGDLLLPKQWRMVAAIEALTGLLMCGLSTGLFFALVSRRIDYWVKVKHGKN